MFTFDHTAFAVKDLAASKAFYEHLGARVVSKPSSQFLEMMLGNLRLHFIQASTGTVDTSGIRIDHVCVSVPSLKDLVVVRDRINAHPALRALGKQFEIEGGEMLGGVNGEPPQHAEERPPLQTLYVQDPDGINIEIRTYA